MSNIIKSNPQKLNEILQAPSVQSQFEQALGDAKGTFISSILSLYTSNTDLTECSPAEVVTEALKAASLKLSLDKNLGFAYVIPYSKKVGNGWVKKPEFQLGYKGIRQLALRSGIYKTLNEDKVYEGELKSRNKKTGEIDLSGEKVSDKVIGYFAYLCTINGFEKTVYMTREEVEEHAATYSKTYKYNNSAWKTDFDKMALKTVVLKLLKAYGQLSIEEQIAIGTDEDIIKNDINSRTEDNITIEIPDNVDVETGEIIEEEVKEKKADSKKDPKKEFPY